MDCPILSLARETQEAILTLVDADAIAELDDCLRCGGDASNLYASRLKTRLTAAMVCRGWNELLEGSELWVDADEVWVWSQCWYPKFCDEALLALTRRCRNLSRLMVSYHPELTDAGVVGAVELIGGRATKLAFNGCAGLTERSCIAIGRHCPNLQDVNLSFGDHQDHGRPALDRVTDVGIWAVIDGCPLITRLQVSFNDECFAEGPIAFQHVTDLSIGKALELKHLRELSIHGCAFSRECVMRLVAEPDLCPLLRTLYVGIGEIGCPITWEDADELKRVRSQQIEARAVVPEGEAAAQKAMWLRRQEFRTF